MTEIHVLATAYSYSIFPIGHDWRRHFEIKVEWRGQGRYAITDGHCCLGRDGEWDYEPLNSERTDEWLDEHRFTLEEAQELAAKVAPTLKIKDLTALDILNRTTDAEETNES